MTDDSSVQVKIVGDASGVAPAVQQASTQVGHLKPIIADINAFLDSARSKFVGFGIAGSEAGKMVATGAREATAAVNAEGNAITRMIMKVHEGAESVRTFQMRAKEFAEVYVALFAVETIAHWIEMMGAAAEKTAKLAAVMGMSVGEVQALGGAATMSGTSIDALQTAMTLLSQKAATAHGNTSSVAKALHAMGISANDGHTNLQRLLIVADKFHGMADGPQKMAVAYQLFGRNAKEIVPFLNQGSAAINDLMEKTKELGGVNEAAQQQGERLASSVNEAKIAWEGLKNTLTEAFGPVLTELVDGFVALVKALVDSYNSGGIVKILFDALSEVIQGFIEIVRDVALAFDQLFHDTKSSGEDWAADIKNFIHEVVDLFKNLIVATVFVADAFIAMWDLIKGAWMEGKAAVTLFVGVIEATLAGFGEFLKVVGKICEDALTLHWGSIAADWDAGMAHVQSVVQQHANEILATTGHMRKQATDDFAAAMNLGKSFDAFQKDIFSGHYAGPKHDAPLAHFGGGTGDAPDVQGGKDKKPKKGKDDLVQKLEEELEQKKAAWEKEQLAQDTAEKFSLQSEADFWDQALKRHDLSAKDRFQITKKWIAAEQALQKDRVAKALDADKIELFNADKNAQLKLQAIQKERDVITRMYKADSNEARAANFAVLQAEREATNQRKQLIMELVHARQQAADEQVGEAQKNAAFEEQMGVISKGKLLQQERQFQNQMYQIDLAALQRDKSLIDPLHDPIGFAKICAQIEALERQHQQKLNEIDRQATLQRTQIQRTAISQVSSAWGQGIGQMMTGQITFHQGVIQIWQGMVQAIGNAISQMVQQFIEGEILKLVFHKTSAASKLTTEAALAGAGGVASMAAAPFPMDMTAPAFGASMSESAMGFMGMLGAEGGDYHVREGLYHLHEDEMVLPAWAASPLRSMIESGGSSGSPPPFMLQHSDPTKAPTESGGDAHYHYAPTINHSDTSWDRLMRENSRDARRWFKGEVRAGRLLPPER